MNKISSVLLLTVVIYTHVSAAVTLTASQVQWKTFSHTVKPDYSLQNDTFSTSLVTHSYNSLILENEYLKVTLVPEYGGRILSMIYKPTGHEQLYRNPVGRPYGPQWDAFYYDWLMVWGGIFPTFPEPEHGKAWCRPWAYEITSNTPEKISVKMTFTDSINFTSPSKQFKYGTTNITCNFEVTLEAQTSVLQTSVTLTNPNNRGVPFEYWTNVGVAPGSAPENTQCDDKTEIIGPVSTIKITDSWPDIRKVEQNTSGDIYRFKNLRWYKNWTNDGIAYAWPVEGNFWGALNHGNSEAILRISDNIKTPGLKLWGFGYNQSRGFDPATNIDYHRPFIELWAGVSKEFFTPAQFAAKSTLQFDEYYMPSVGLVAFTHASEHATICLAADKTEYDAGRDKDAIVSCRYVVARPADRVTLSLQFKSGTVALPVHEVTRVHDANGPFEIRDTVAVKSLCNDINRLAFELRSDSRILMSAEIPVAVSNAGSCAVSAKPPVQQPIRARTDSEATQKLYSVNGVFLGKTRERTTLSSGIVLSVDNIGRCRRFVVVP